MAKIYCKSSYLLRRDTAANWRTKNPILREGEEGYETDTGKRKVGDGTTEWNNLKYDSGIVDQTYAPTSENAQSGKAVSEAISEALMDEDFIGQQVNEWLDEHPEATTTVQDASIGPSKLTVAFKKSLRNNYVNVLDYGATGDGSTDDTAAIKNAVAALQNGGTLFFPSGIYRVTISAKQDDVIVLNALNDITVLSDNARIIVSNNKYTHYNIILAKNCDNLIIDGLYIVGDRLGHDYSTISGTHEFGYGIFILGDDSNKSVNVEIKNCNISEMTGDAIVTKNGVSGGEIYIHDCKIRKCRRQGISVLDTDKIVIRNVDIKYIGDFDGVAGTAPKSCIDFEAASGTKEIQSVIIDGSTFKYASTYAVVGIANNIIITNSELSDVHLKVLKQDLYEAKIIDCKFITDTQRPQYFNLGQFKIYNCVFDIQHGTANLAEIWHNGIFNSYIKGNRYEGNENVASYISIRGSIQNCILEDVRLVHSKSSGISVCKGNTFTNCSFQFYTTPPVLQNCIFENCFRSPDYSPTVKYANCVLDTKIYPSTLYNCTVLDEV